MDKNLVSQEQALEAAKDIAPDVIGNPLIKTAFLAAAESKGLFETLNKLANMQMAIELRRLARRGFGSYGK